MTKEKEKKKVKLECPNQIASKLELVLGHASKNHRFWPKFLDSQLIVILKWKIHPFGLI